MKVIFAQQDLEYLSDTSIFLAGPTPRNSKVPSWRPQVLSLLEKHNFNGTILVPESEGWGVTGDYYSQIEWEDQALHLATVILFWIPRKLETMPGFTTNDEWGYWKKSGKVVLGVPNDAEKCKYQIHYAKKLRIPFANNLEETVANSLTLLHNLEEIRVTDICNSYI